MPGGMTMRQVVLRRKRWQSLDTSPLRLGIFPLSPLQYSNLAFSRHQSSALHAPPILRSRGFEVVLRKPGGHGSSRNTTPLPWPCPVKGPCRALPWPIFSHRLHPGRTDPLWRHTLSETRIHPPKAFQGMSDETCSWIRHRSILLPPSLSHRFNLTGPGRLCPSTFFQLNQDSVRGIRVLHWR